MVSFAKEEERIGFFHGEEGGKRARQRGILFTKKHFLTDLFRAAEKSFRTKGGNRHSFVRTFFSFPRGFRFLLHYFPSFGRITFVLIV
ncbi:hypothetical protein B4135_3239 [Caldibacillus debilis]|uniref:Uncharacterized protein n=1 Tax=Caldibacillus debilis TaxID=301148 RepID=A0A150LFR8_9BACI|nr:hypothetical protein B4135_3239 [Caldibacillus debilis]